MCEDNHEKLNEENLFPGWDLKEYMWNNCLYKQKLLAVVYIRKPLRQSRWR